jgi:hypothetical protein
MKVLLEGSERLLDAGVCGASLMRHRGTGKLVVVRSADMLSLPGKAPVSVWLGKGHAGLPHIQASSVVQAQGLLSHAPEVQAGQAFTTTAAMYAAGKVLAGLRGGRRGGVSERQDLEQRVFVDVLTNDKAERRPSGVQHIGHLDVLRGLDLERVAKGQITGNGATVVYYFIE